METMLLLHGWPQTAHIWRHITPALSAQYHILAPDLPGLGQSEFTTQYDTAHIAQVLKAYLEKNGVEKCHIAGHDIGAWVAVAFALQYEATCLSLTVMDAGIPGLMPAALFQPANAGKVWQFYFHAIADMPEFLVAGKEKEYLNWYFDHKAFVKGSVDNDHYVQAYIAPGRMTAGFNYYRAFNKSAAQNNALLRKLNIPVLAIGGEYAVGAQMKAVAEALSEKGRTEVIPGCGHYIPEEQPVKVIELLRDQSAL